MSKFRGIDLAERLLTASFAGQAAQRRFAPNSDWEESATGDLSNSNLYLQRLLAGAPDFEDTSKFAPYDDYFDEESGDYYGDSAFPDQDDIKFWYPPERIVDEKTLKAQHAKFDARAKALVKKALVRNQNCCDGFVEAQNTDRSAGAQADETSTAAADVQTPEAEADVQTSGDGSVLRITARGGE